MSLSFFLKEKSCPNCLLLAWLLGQRTVLRAHHYPMAHLGVSSIAVYVLWAAVLSR